MQSPLPWLACAGIVIVLLYAHQNGGGYLVLLPVPVSWLVVHFYYEHRPYIEKMTFITRAHTANLLGQRERFSELQSAAASLPRVYPVATIESNLKKKLDRVLGYGGHLVITGGDGYPIAKENYKWERHIREFLQKGCKITQYVVEPTKEADAKFRELASEFPNEDCHCAGGRFEYKKLIPPSAGKDEQGRALVLSLMTVHPTLAHNESGQKMLWLERHHPRKSTKAFMCEYYSPQDLAVESRPYDEYNRLLKVASRYMKEEENHVG